MKKGTKYIVGGAVVVGLYLLAKREVNQVVAAAGNAVDPTSSKNFAHRFVNHVGDALNGPKQDDFSFGAWIYEITHDAEGNERPRGGLS